ncbi:MAG: hypothetical protein ACREQ5_02695 [Candidatus Dormibacteria bacterium]
MCQTPLSNQQSITVSNQLTNPRPRAVRLAESMRLFAKAEQLPKNIEIATGGLNKPHCRIRLDIAAKGSRDDPLHAQGGQRH